MIPKNVAKEDRNYIAFLIVLTSGMRQGEILGLHWKDIDFENWSLKVVQTLSHDGKELQSGTKIKSGISRIDLPEQTLAALKSHKVMIAKEKLYAGCMYEDSDLIVCTTIGTIKSI